MGGIRFSCVCGEEFSIPDEHAGKNIRCKACGESTVVPLPGGAPIPPQGVDAPPAGYAQPPSSGIHPAIIVLIVLIISMGAIAVLAIVAAIAIPLMIAPTSLSSETRSITMLRALMSAQASYQVMHNGQFAVSPKDLADAGLIGLERAFVLDGGNEANYTFMFQRSGSNFTCYGNPMDEDAGTRSFFINASGTIRWIENYEGVQHTAGGESWSVLGN